MSWFHLPRKGLCLLPLLWVLVAVGAASAQTEPADARIQADAHVEQGLAHLEQFNKFEPKLETLDQAVAALEAALKDDPQHIRAHKLLDVVKEQRRRTVAKLNPDPWQMAFLVVGGLGIFLLGMKNMSEGVQAVAGARLRRMINAVTDNRLLAVGVGTGVTCVVQSSSITSVIVVGLVNSGLMLLHQAIGVIMGANIGTTITGWILVLNIGKYGLPIVGLCVFVYLFTRSDRWRYLAMAGMGLGLIFFGLELMKDGFQPLRDLPVFQEAFIWFKADSFVGVLKCVLVGTLVTGVIQSSSATLGVTIALAITGGLDFQTATALVLGQNIGTTVTAWLATLGATVNAKRAAYFHIAFNVLGVIIIVPIFRLYIELISDIVRHTGGADPRTLIFDGSAQFESDIKFAIASAHTVFNVMMTVLMLPFVRYSARALERLVPDKAIEEIPHLTSLDTRFLDSPVLAIENSRGEILKMSRGVMKMLGWTREILNQEQPDEQLVQKTLHREKIMDNVQAEVIHFLTDVLTGEVPHEVTIEGRRQLRVTDEFESVSDYVSNILKAHLRMHNKGLKLSEKEHAQLMHLHDRVTEYVQMVAAGFEHNQADILARAQSASQAITREFKDLREAHLTALTEVKIDPVQSMSYTTMLTGYRKIKEHALNIAEAIATS